MRINESFEIHTPHKEWALPVMRIGWGLGN